MIDWNWWITSLSAFTAPVTAGITTYIAYQQWRTNKDRLRVELYDRRASVLRATKRLLSIALQTGELTFQQVQEFAAATAEARFVLDAKIASLLEAIRERAIQVSTRSDAMSRMQPGAQLAAMRRTQGEDLMWMEEQLRALDERFGKYLTLP